MFFFIIRNNKCFRKNCHILTNILYCRVKIHQASGNNNLKIILRLSPPYKFRFLTLSRSSIIPNEIEFGKITWKNLHFRMGTKTRLLEEKSGFYCKYILKPAYIHPNLELNVVRLCLIFGIMPRLCSIAIFSYIYEYISINMYIQ